MKYLSSFVVAFVVLALADYAYASDAHQIPWGNFLLRLLNFAIFIGMLWYFAGKLIKAFIAKHQASIKENLETASSLRKS